MPARPREFFATKTVAQALAGFRPARRTGGTSVPLDEALGRVPVAPVTAPHPLPGFARSTVDGFAVRAADTYGASEGLPGYLQVTGAVAMGAEPAVRVGPGTAVSVPTGAVRPDEDAAAGAELVPAGRPLRAQDLGMLAAAGVTRVAVRARPLVTIVSTGDEVVPPRTARLRPGQVRDACAVALAGLVAQAGGEPACAGIVPDDPGALEAALRAALPASDLIVVSAGSSVGARDETAGVVGRLGAPGIWCHGLAIKPGKPTLLAECDGVPVIGLPGHPRSALVVFRLIGMPLVRLIGGCTAPPPEPVARARLARGLASAAGRLDVVQVRVRDGVATPLFGPSALLSVLTAADGYLVIPDEATGLAEGAEVEVTLYR